MALSITKLSISSHSGPNRRPGSGYVTYSDGKDYAFHRDPVDEVWTISGQVRMAGTLTWRGVRSPKRIALLRERLEG